jgi:hypothetical protein
VTCATCQEMAATECLTCPASRTFTAGTAPAGTCPCATGYAEASPVVNACVACHFSCSTCLVGNDQAQCSVCQTGRTASAGTAPFSCPCSPAHVQISQVCQPCATGCTACTGTTTYCTSCDSGSGYWLSRALHSCALTCPAGEFAGPTPGQCEYCDGTSPNYCATCTSLTLCTYCVSGRVLLVNACVTRCPAKMFNSSNICANCPTQCATCTSLATCTTCEPSYYLFSGQCLTACPPDYLA